MSKSTSNDPKDCAFGDGGHSVPAPLFRELGKESILGPVDVPTDTQVGEHAHLRLLPNDSTRRSDATREELLEHQIEST